MIIQRIMRKARVDIDDEQLTWVTNSRERAVWQPGAGRLHRLSDRPVSPTARSPACSAGTSSIRRLPSASSVRSNIAFVKSGLYLGVWKDFENDVDRRKDHEQHALADLHQRVFRRDATGPSRLLEVLCADTGRCRHNA
jgi:hypothetical protein